MKLNILRVTDLDDSNSDEMYFTIKRLRAMVLDYWYDDWGKLHEPHEQDYTKEQIKSSDEDLISYMNSWNYEVEVILTITENDI